MQDFVHQQYGQGFQDLVLQVQAQGLGALSSFGVSRSGFMARVSRFRV